jgi:poly(glycerol-phosphate) alpha-glucosyltransferase
VAASTDNLSIAFLAPSLSRQGGGIFEIQRCLAQHLQRLPGVQVEAYGTVDTDLQYDKASWGPIPVHAFPFYGPKQFRWSPSLASAFGRSTSDVGHLHALWMHTSLIIRNWAHRRAKPVMVSAHGMLEPWALQNARWKKAFSAALYERRSLADAACIHVGSANELRSTRAFGLKNPVCIVPNGVILPDAHIPATDVSDSGRHAKKSLLYLGRLHPKKGLMNLLEAWRTISLEPARPTRGWTLSIAGWDQGGHEAELKRSAAELGIVGDVEFPGPLFGSAKISALSRASAFVLPSHSEGLPMAVLEAWSYAKPVLMTPQCNLAEGEQVGAALLAHPTSESLAEGLRALFEATDIERTTMGRRGFELVRHKYTWNAVASEMCEVYRWLVRGGPRPSCVALD